MSPNTRTEYVVQSRDVGTDVWRTIHVDPELVDAKRVHSNLVASPPIEGQEYRVIERRVAVVEEALP